MTIREDRREAALEHMADHVLSVGLAGATLRPLAGAAGTSDRMLLYYFTNKDDLLTAVLERIAARLLADLTTKLGGRQHSFATLLEDVWTVLNSPEHRPYMSIWFDLASAAVRGLEPHRKVAGAIADAYIFWLEDRLEQITDGSHPKSAALFLSAMQGMYLFNAIGRNTLSAAAMIALTKE